MDYTKSIHWFSHNVDVSGFQNINGRSIQATLFRKKTWCFFSIQDKVYLYSESKILIISKFFRGDAIIRYYTVKMNDREDVKRAN